MLHWCSMGEKPRGIPARNSAIKMRENPAVTPWAEFLKLVLGIPQIGFRYYVNICLHVYTIPITRVHCSLNILPGRVKTSSQNSRAP